MSTSVEMNPHYFKTLFPNLNVKFQFDSIWVLKFSFYTATFGAGGNYYPQITQIIKIDDLQCKYKN